MIDLLTQLFTSFKHSPLAIGLLSGLCITAFNAFGSALVLLVNKNISQRALDTALGFAAGLMLAASFTSLIIPGAAIAGIVPVIIGMVGGVLFLDATTHIIPHIHSLAERSPSKQFSSLWLFIMAITIHNMPEGLSVGISTGSADIRNMVVLMLAIGIQNIPEGFSVAFSHFAQEKRSRLRSAWIGIQSGLVEVPLALLGALLVSSIHSILPYAMGFGAGAMLYVISGEIIPDTHNKGHERYATWGTIAGVIVMLLLDMGLV